ncbi:protein of unknown function DUF86 [Thermaerobacter marianensis DSM 12885]|uniref:DUF86 domain-containing protein n=1 Tax=Thermaerobacter marianensis (strain ATCC 700841 / DSM 12885 / JCM 10246 / 7p75a) TaxID=644966 RepID=E6SHU9_THEM7|nr:HepT-like ribonuclease domain-containing protein [Thermaerobacter marianensis]ADU50796.1 protein of unknown function DUF86 [Thermaerobacter marianensis DSM 12885]
MDLTFAQRHAIRIRIDVARQELADLQRFRELTRQQYRSDRDRRRIVERIIETVADVVVDIAKILGSATGHPMPAACRETMRSLAGVGLASEEQAEALTILAELRKTLTYRYLDDNWQGVRWFLVQGSQTVVQWLNRCHKLVTPYPE